MPVCAETRLAPEGTGTGLTVFLPVFLVVPGDAFDFVSGAHEDGDALVEPFGDDVEHGDEAVGGGAACLFDDHGHEMCIRDRDRAGCCRFPSWAGSVW